MHILCGPYIRNDNVSDCNEQADYSVDRTVSAYLLRVTILNLFSIVTLESWLMPTLGYNIWNPSGQSSCCADPTMAILCTRNPFLANGGVNPRKSTVPRSCWTKSVMPSASNTIPSDEVHPLAPSKPTWAGSSVTSISTTCVTRLTGALPRSRPYSPAGS